MSREDVAPRTANATGAPPSFVHRGVALLVHALAVSFVWSVYVAGARPAVVLFAGGATILPMSLILLFREVKLTRKIFNPLTYYFLISAVHHGIAAMYMADWVLTKGPVPFAIVLVRPQELAFAYCVYIAGVLALHAGLQLTRPRRDFGDDAPVPQNDNDLIVLWVVSIGARNWAAFASIFGAAAGILNWGSLAALAAFALRRSRTRLMSTLAVMAIGTIIEFAMSLRSGSKAYIMYSFFPLAWMLVADPRLRKLFPPFVATALAFYLAILQPVVAQSRLERSRSGESTTEKLVRVYGESDSGRIQTDEEREHFLLRSFDPIPVGFLAGEVERFGFKDGETLEYLSYAFIPRIIWPEKPGVTRGSWFTVYLGVANQIRDAETSNGQTAVGELYWNFGIPGVLGGMALFGVLSGWIWRLATDMPERSALKMALYVSISLGMADMPEAGTVLTALVYRLLVLGLPIYLLGTVIPTWRDRALPAKRGMKPELITP